MYISRAGPKIGQSWETVTKRTERKEKNLSVRGEEKKKDDNDREILFCRDNFRVSVAKYFASSGKYHLVSIA